jgi:hypothetical protein
MSEQLWGIGGVVAGIAVSTAGAWWNERSKHEREHGTVAKKENRKRCEELLTQVDAELGHLEHYQDEHGVFPVDDGHGTVSATRNHLKDIHLNCPPKVHAAAIALVEAVEGWESGGGTREAVDSSRHRFIELVRKKL